MSNSRDFVQHVQDLAASMGRVTARAMFGGHGLYVDGTIVGIVVDDVLYLKTDEATRAAFVALDLRPFQYRTRKGDVQITGYLRAPDEALESAPAMHEWLRLALAAALRSRTPKGEPSQTSARRTTGRRARKASRRS